MNNLESIIGFYTENAKRYQYDVRSLAWGSQCSQEKRFEILSEIADLRGQCVWDVGCGLGDLWGWLCRHVEDVQYVGVDITPVMIELARAHYPNVDFRVLNIVSMPNETICDYALASGVFNLKMKEDSASLKAVLIKMFSLSRKGMAFNIMSTKADFTNHNEYYANPGEMLNFCLTLSRKVVLRHDYMTHDFTVYVYRE